jgi:transcriptional regulator GlxA family with amidase domain
MKNITILALNGSVASTITGPMDVFYLAGILYNVICGMKPTPYFKVRIATLDGKPAKCLNRFMIQPHCSLQDIEDTDLIMISALAGDVLGALNPDNELSSMLKDHYEAGSHIASVCTGAFVLASTGLLDGKTATTHWGFVDIFRHMFPQVDLRPECLVTDESDLYCSGGSNSCLDLSLHLIEKMCSREVAVQCAKAMVHDIGRFTQAPYAAFHYPKRHADHDILAAQIWIEENYSDNISIPMLAQRCAMSQRTFERRFKSATGDTPLAYLQKVRTEAAKSMLEKENATFEEVTFHVGYEDASSFRKIFQRNTGLRPRQYQQLFQKRNC